MFDRLDFVYMPSGDVAADTNFYAHTLGAEVVFAIERFQTRVAMIRLTEAGPAILLAEHLEGDQPILVFRVDDLGAAEQALGSALGEAFEMPFGTVRLVQTPGPQRLAIYEATRADRGASLTGRRDF
jgi:hypothetical protein